MSARARISHRTYYGHDIFPADLNSSGIRWYSRAEDGTTLRADTLAGLRWFIRDHEQRSGRRVRERNE